MERRAQTIEIRVDPGIANTVALMLRSHVSGIPVMDTFLRTLADLLTISDSEVTTSDVETRNEVLDQIDSVIGQVKGLIRIGVHRGVAEIRGVIADEGQHRTLRKILESAPGLSAVHDHLIWIDPTTGAFLEATAESAASNPPARTFQN
jgi:hypothetical protein